MKKFLKFAVVLLLVMVSVSLVSSCSAFYNSIYKEAKGFSSGHYKVKLYSCGKDPVIEYDVTGFINTESQSDGYYFIDNHGKLVRISGNIVIEQM